MVKRAQIWPLGRQAATDAVVGQRTASTANATHVSTYTAVGDQGQARAGLDNGSDIKQYSNLLKDGYISCAHGAGTDFAALATTVGNGLRRQAIAVHRVKQYKRTILQMRTLLAVLAHHKKIKKRRPEGWLAVIFLYSTCAWKGHLQEPARASTLAHVSCKIMAIQVMHSSRTDRKASSDLTTLGAGSRRDCL